MSAHVIITHMVFLHGGTGSAPPFNGPPYDVVLLEGEKASQHCLDHEKTMRESEQKKKTVNDATLLTAL